MNTLSFPGLGLEFHLNPVAFTIGDFSIKWYGIIIALAFLCGITYVLYRVKDFGLDGDRVIDVILGGAVGAIVGARLYYVIFSWDLYKDNPIDIFKTWEGGIAIYGGIIGGFLIGLLMCRIRRVRFWPMADLAVGGLILGQAIGRWGNFVNIEAFGGNTDLPWGMTSPVITEYLRAHMVELEGLNMTIDPNMPVHPTFFYESVWCLIGFVVIVLFTKHRRFDGELVLLYSAWYGAGRAVIEGLRTDSLLWGTLRVSQVLAILCTLASLIIWAAIRSRIRRSSDPDYLKLYVQTEEGQSVLAGTFYQKKGKKAQEEAGILAETEETVPQTTGQPAEGEDTSKAGGEAEDTQEVSDAAIEESPEETKQEQEKQ